MRPSVLNASLVALPPGWPFDPEVLATRPPKVLVLTTFDLDEYVFAALQAGAAGFLLKDAGPSEQLAAIRAVHTGNAVAAPGPTRRLLDRFLPVLTASGTGLSRQ